MFKVKVVQKMVILEVNMNEVDVLLLIKKLTATPTIHSTTVLYTQIPISLLSLRAAMVTCKIKKEILITVLAGHIVSFVCFVLLCFALFCLFVYLFVFLFLFCFFFISSLFLIKTLRVVILNSQRFFLLKEVLNDKLSFTFLVSHAKKAPNISSSPL